MTRPRVLVTRKLPGAAFDRLAELTDMQLVPTTADFTRELANAEGILCTLVDRIDAALLERAPKLRALASCSVGLDHVDLAACTARGIAVGYTPGVLVETTAELAFALLLASARRVVESDRFLRAGHWTEARRWEPDMLLGRDLSGATLGIVASAPSGKRWRCVRAPSACTCSASIARRARSKACSRCRSTSCSRAPTS